MPPYKKWKKRKLRSLQKSLRPFFLHTESLWRVKKVIPKVVVRKMKALESRSVLSRCVVCLRRQGLGWAQVFCGLYINAEAGGLLCWWVLSTSCLQAPFHGIKINEQFSGFFNIFFSYQSNAANIHRDTMHICDWIGYLKMSRSSKYVPSSMRI